jgi:hypothetical protein
MKDRKLKIGKRMSVQRVFIIDIKPFSEEHLSLQAHLKIDLVIVIANRPQQAFSKAS